MTVKTLRAASAAVLPLLILLSCKSGKDAEAGANRKGRTPRFAAVVAAKAPFLDSRGGIATVSAGEQVELKVESSGRIAEVLFREGGAVPRGAVLVRLEDSETRALRDRAAAKARLAAATLSRLREQVRVEAASAQQVEAAAADSAVAAADLALAEVALEKTRVRAPFAGVAGLLDVSRGQWVQAGQKLTRLVSRSDARLDWTLPEGEATRVRVGTLLPFRNPATGREGRAVVVALDPAIDEVTRTRGLRARCREGCEQLLAGMAVEVRLPQDSSPVLSVPAHALSGSARGPALFVFRAGKAVQVPVAPGRRSHESIEILSGLDVGDTVLIPGASPPKPGAAVEIARLQGAGEAGGDGEGRRGAAAGSRGVARP